MSNLSNLSDASREHTIAQFIADAHEVLAHGGVTESSLRALGDLLRRLAQLPDLIPDHDLAAMHGSDSSATVLHSDGAEAMTLVLAKFSPTAETPIHDHGSWAVACVVRGRDRYRHWERLDDSANPSHAELRLLYERELGPGDVVYWLDPPDDIHSQQGIDEPVWELLLFGKNAMIRPRHYFDPTTGAVRVALPQ